MASLFCVSFAGAEEKAPTPPAEEPRAIQGGTVRRDPEGLTGVSSFWEKLAKADGVAAARDFNAAIALYREAIAESPQNPLGHYRVGQALTLAANLEKAELAYAAALRFVANDNPLKAKLLFCLADLRERQRLHEQAIAAFGDYEAHVQTNQAVGGHPASAAERKKRNQEWIRISAEAAEVRLRSEKRLKEADEATRKRAR